MPVRDPEARALLGLRPLPALKERVLDAACAGGERGVSARELHRSDRTVDILCWMAAAHELMDEGRLRCQWAPVKGDPVVAQEGRYLLPPPEESADGIC